MTELVNSSGGDSDGLEQSPDSVVGVRAQAVSSVPARLCATPRRRWRRQSRVVTKAHGIRAAVGCSGCRGRRPRGDRALRRAARALEFQLPRRRLLAREARRRSRAARPARLSRSPITTASTASCASPRRPRARQVKTVFGAELSLELAAPQNGESPTPRASTCSCSRAARRATTGSPRRSRTRNCAGPRRAARSTTSTSSPSRRAGTGSILTGCRKGAVRRALAEGGAARRRHPISIASSTLFGARCTCIVELFDHGNPLDSEHNDVLAALAAERGLPVVATRATCTTPSRSSISSPGPRGGAGAPQPRRAGRLAARASGAHTCARGPRWPRASRATPARSRAPSRSPTSWLPAAPRQARAAEAERCPRGTRRCLAAAARVGRRCRARSSSTDDDDASGSRRSSGSSS